MVADEVVTTDEVVTPKSEEKPKAGKKAEVADYSFNTVIRAVSSLLVDAPQALTVVLMKEGDRSVYRHVEDTAVARKVRREARKLLRSMWAAGAYNYHEIAAALRVEDLDVQGLIDEEFAERSGLV